MGVFIEPEGRVSLPGVGKGFLHARCSASGTKCAKKWIFSRPPQLFAGISDTKHPLFFTFPARSTDSDVNKVISSARRG